MLGSRVLAFGSSPVTPRETHPGWGLSPWKVDFTPPAQATPAAADIVIVGGGFTGLAAAAWLRQLAPEKSVAVLEAGTIGAGASGRTGGVVLAETGAGELPGLGDVLQGFTDILEKLEIQCDLSLPGAWEIGRSEGLASSGIDWEDSGRLRVTSEVPGGTLDPGMLVSELARAACRRGARVMENHKVVAIAWGERPVVKIRGDRRPDGGKITAGKVLLATNALSLEVSGIVEGAHPRLTLASLTEPLREEQIAAIGLRERKPFYTEDLPYLWGRVRSDNSIVWGAGLVSAPDANDLEDVRVEGEEPARMFAVLEKRVRGLHPALAGIRFTHRWGGPILFRDSWTPVFDWHPRCAGARNGIVLGAYAGHGVALSSYLGAWAAEALLGRRDLPSWGSVEQ